MKNIVFRRLRKLILLLWLTGCGLTACTGLRRGEKLREHVSEQSVDVLLTDRPTDSISLVYTGCSSFFVRYGERIVVHDPFFSNAGPLGLLGFKKLRSDTDTIDRFFTDYLDGPRDEAGRIKALLVSHTHYDHVMDVPYIYEHVLNRDSTRLYGNEDLLTLMSYAADTVEAFGDEIISVEEFSPERDAAGRFYTRDRRIRFLPIATTHAPHYHALHLFQGHVSKVPSRAGHWKEGATFSYLIDFLDADGAIAFRAYLNSAAAGAPKTFIDKNILTERPVDVAVLCAASFKYVDGYPKYFIDALEPRHVILAHWENFFRRREQLHERPRSVPFTNVPKLLEEIHRLQADAKLPFTYTLPALNAEINVHF